MFFQSKNTNFQVISKNKIQKHSKLIKNELYYLINSNYENFFPSM